MKVWLEDFFFENQMNDASWIDYIFKGTLVRSSYENEELAREVRGE
jgi:hypothetical protein